MHQNYINHVVLLLDRSGSMSGLEGDVIKVTDSIVKNLAQRSKQMDQETRVSIYIFDDVVENIVYDQDALRLASIRDIYRVRGGTGLIDATIKVISDLEQTATLYGDHAFLLYVVSDGQETNNPHGAPSLAKRINGLPENWTLAAFVPDPMALSEAKKYGFPANNVSLWNTTDKGVEEVGKVINEVTNNFMTLRSTGTKGTKNLFSLNTNISKSSIKKSLQELDPKSFEVLHVRQYDDGKAIKDFVEAWKIPYRVGGAYYQLSKTEKIQASKNILVRQKFDGKVFSGPTARSILGLPSHEVKVAPASYADFDVFIQSTSVNRKLVKDTDLVVIK